MSSQTQSNILTPQQKMDAAFVNYFALSEILRDDLNTLLNEENNTQYWRRNFIRVSVSLIEGYTHCLKDFCSISLECKAPEINIKETKALQFERKYGVCERIKYTLSGAYKLFQLESAPNFGDNKWTRAKRVLEKRHFLMHPRTPEDLAIRDDLWDEIRSDITWILEQFFNFFSLLRQKYDGQ